MADTNFFYLTSAVKVWKVNENAGQFNGNFTITYQANKSTKKAHYN